MNRRHHNEDAKGRQGHHAESLYPAGRALPGLSVLVFPLRFHGASFWV